MDPVYLFFITSFILILYLNKLIIGDKYNYFIIFLLVGNVVFSICLIFIGVNIFGSNSELLNMIYTLVNVLVFLLIVFATFKNSSKMISSYQVVLNSLNECKTDIYIMLDEMDKIKDISKSMLEELGVTREEVIKKNYFNIVNNNIRILKLNEEEVDNDYFKAFYRKYRDRSFDKTFSEKREITFANYQGDIKMINVIESPLIINGKYRGRIIVGEKLSDSVLLEVEKDLKGVKLEAEALRQKFIATLEMIEDAVFYYDIEKGYIWGNDIYKDLLGLDGNTIKFDAYKNRIFSDDWIAFEDIINNLKNYQKYKISYRFLKGKKHIWIKEVSKKVDDGKVILGVVKEIKGRPSPIEKGYIDLPDEEDYYMHVKDAVNTGKKVGIIRVNLTNVIEINQRNGRKVGDMMINEYITRINNSFNLNGLKIFRLGGIDYALVITDNMQYDVITKSLSSASGNRLMNLTLEFGSVVETLEPSLGISSGPEDGKTSEEIIDAAEKAVSMAKKKTFRNSYCFYKEISDLDHVTIKKKNQISLNLTDFHNKDE